ncbi:hypothetical protein ABVT39_018937 [Epinephelus coioides]
MFSWGEDSQRGFQLKDGSHVDSRPTTDDGVRHVNLGYHITDLSAGHNVLAFVKSNGNSFIIRTNESKDGRRVRGKQKFVKFKEKIEDLSCGDDLVTLLSETGKVLCVDTTCTYIPRPVEALCNIVVSQVACGSQHSVALTKNGQVYTWGQDSRGQLGLGRRKLGASSPQHLRSLSAIPLVQIAAGGEQSFALSVSGGVFGWGRNNCGQLGLGDTTDRNTPTPVHCLNMKKSIHISCGKDHTAVLTKDIHEKSNTDSVNNVTQHCLDNMIDKWISECDLKSWKKIKHKDKHFQTSPKYSGLNLKLAQLAFKKLVKKDTVFAEVEAAVLHLLPSLDKKPVSVEGLRILLLLNELLHVTQRHKRHQTSTKLAEAVAAAVLNLSADSLQVIGNWWSSLSPSTMVRHVKVWKQALSMILSSECVPPNSGVRNLLLVLQYMYNVSISYKMPTAGLQNLKPCITPELKALLKEKRRAFNSGNKEELKAVQKELRRNIRRGKEGYKKKMEEQLQQSDVSGVWRGLKTISGHKQPDSQARGDQQWNGHAEPLILCSFPTVMDLESKKFVFDLNVNYTKELDSIRPLHQDLLLKLDVRRASVLEDTFKQLAVVHHSHYKFPLVQPKQEDQRYFQFGVLCGLALYNKCIIHLPFPLALFKKLLGVKPSLSDMIEFFIGADIS